MRLRSHRVRTAFLIVLSASFFGAGVFIVWAATLTMPDLASLEARKVVQSTKIYDRTGEILLYDLHANVERTVVPFEQISRNIKNAAVAIEDTEFYTHYGIRPTSIVRAILSNLLITLHLSSGYTQGGSTITQQVVKNTLLTVDKTPTRKLKEWVLAVKIDRALSKEKILELYLNESPYGGNLYGIEEASREFLGKSAADLTIAEAAYLAALPQAPTYYSPYGNHKDALERRKNLVLDRMLESGFVTAEEYAAAKEEIIEFRPQSDSSLKAAHFVFYIRDYLENKYGARALDELGLKVTTTLDYSLQQKAEEIVNKYALKNEKDFNASNAALVAIDPKTGQVLSMVGSRDYFDEDIDGNFNVAIANRQPGSTFKPFAYAAAFKKGYTPETVVFDVPTQFQTTCAPDNFTSEGDCYSPQNFDDKFRGPMTLREALAQSINVPSVKTMYLAGTRNALETARDLGITSLGDISRYGLTLVLGGGEVSLLELTSAYGVFANDGVRNPPVGILEITDASGVVLEKFVQEQEQVLDPEIARQISDILSDNIARAPAFGTNSPLTFTDRDVTAKTGTTNDYRDVWTVGYSPDIAVGVWGGNNDNTPIKKQVAGFVIAPMWREFMDHALAELPPTSFKNPDYSFLKDLKPILRGVWQGGQTYTVDKYSGKLATETTPLEAREERAISGVHSILYWVDRENPRGAPPANPNEDSQFRLWEPPVRLWAAAHGYLDGVGGAPGGVDDVHTPQNSPVLSFIAPGQGASFAPNDRIAVSVNIKGKYPITKVEYYINNLFVGYSTQAPYVFSFTPSSVQTIAPQNTLTAIAFDNVLNRGTAETNFLIKE